MNWIRLLVGNFLFLTLGILLLEGGFLLYQFLRPTEAECKNIDWIAYGYCPNKTVEKILGREDGDKIVISFTDELGGRKYTETGTSLNSDLVKNIVIGDSFIQADEMELEKSLVGLLNKAGFETYGLGYSSWNVIQYFDAVKKIGRSEKNYIIFLMSNDILPSYRRSVYAEKQNSETIIGINIQNLFIYKAFSLIKQNLYDRIIKIDQRGGLVPNLFGKERIAICEDIEFLKQLEMDKLDSFDYAVYSKLRECWPQLHEEAYLAATDVMRDLIAFVENDLTSTIKFVFVVPGWAFENENTFGRTVPRYSIPKEISVSQHGLYVALTEDFPDIQFLDTEEFFETEKRAQCHNLMAGDCANKFFFANDGHWNTEAHGALATHLLNLNYVH